MNFCVEKISSIVQWKTDDILEVESQDNQQIMRTRKTSTLYGFLSFKKKTSEKSFYDEGMKKSLRKINLTRHSINYNL